MSEETSPAASLLVSNTFADDRMGLLLAVSHSERDVQINRIETAGWRGGQTILTLEMAYYLPTRIFHVTGIKLLMSKSVHVPMLA